MAFLFLAKFHHRGRYSDAENLFSHTTLMRPVHPDLVQKSGDSKEAGLVPSGGPLPMEASPPGTKTSTTPDQNHRDEANRNTESDGNPDVRTINPDDFPGTESPVPQGILNDDDLDKNATVDIGLAVRRARYQLGDYPALFKDVVEVIAKITSGGATVTWASNKVIKRFQRIIRERYDSGERQKSCPLTRAELLASQYCHPYGEGLPAVQKKLTAMGFSCFDFGDLTFKIYKELLSRWNKYRIMIDKLRGECSELESTLLTKLDTCMGEAAKLETGQLENLSGESRNAREELRSHSEELRNSTEQLTNNVGDLGQTRGEIVNCIESALDDLEKFFHKIGGMVWRNVRDETDSSVALFLKEFDAHFEALNKLKDRLQENYKLLEKWRSVARQNLKALKILQETQASMVAVLANKSGEEDRRKEDKK
ncbi:uncharacterized protein QC761_114595 [Podospora bellae-mahoneyi]|uniref:Uncharacterized protein n=1 Tax=Podospora bellae-mahoneyi TaxID=2093777 RepID=A0ABR0FZN6_9PEZI|nr:hypothetical protein QC761_114595 [Podospora bellae-mahoneyi]